MTLDEHIHKAEDDAMMAVFDTEWGIGNYFIDRTEALEYAKECRQLAEWLKDYKRLKEQEPCEDAISRQAVEDKLLKLCNELEGIFANIRMQNQDESVCGLCEYDCPAPYECPGFDTEDCFKLAYEIRYKWQSTEDLHSVKPQEPQAVLYSGDGYADGCMVYDMAECPTCGYEYEYGDKDWGLPFCPNCSQKLNWERSDKE